MKRLLIVPIALLSLFIGTTCNVTVEDEEGKEVCVDELIAKAGKDRAKLEAEAKSRGIEASAVLLEIHHTLSKVSDVLFDCSANQYYLPFCDSTAGLFVRARSAQKAVEVMRKQLAARPEDSLDIVFMIDGTGSMADDIFAVKSGLDTLLGAMAGKQLRISEVVYRDINVDQNWYQRNPHNFVPAGDSELRTYLSGIVAMGGGDLPESIYDAVAKTLTELPWASRGRILVVLTDAGPLSGSLTHTTLEQVVQLCIQKRVVPMVVLVNLF